VRRIGFMTRKLKEIIPMENAIETQEIIAINILV